MIIKGNKLLLLIIIIVIFLIPMVIILLRMNRPNQEFDGQRAFNDVEYQVGLGPRTMDSLAHDRAVTWISNKLQKLAWTVETQETVVDGQVVKNLIAKRGSGTPWIILASHYDSRLYADQDPNPENHSLPVMGANDGASGAAILLEIARVIPARLDKQIWLVFFDDEDNGTSSGSGWAQGAQYFVSELNGTPDSVVVLDMVGDKDLNIYMEKNSNRDLNKEIWGVANELGFSQFSPTYKHDVIDDHIPFIKAGIRAVDVIDFDYPYWHTTSDTLDKISADSLKVVGKTILTWLEQFPK